jgi:hypothetical protein
MPFSEAGMNADAAVLLFATVEIPTLFADVPAVSRKKMLPL